MNEDPDPGGKMNADPCGSRSTVLPASTRDSFVQFLCEQKQNHGKT